MDEITLKHVAMPPKLFGAPMFPALINFIISWGLFPVMLGLHFDPAWTILLVLLFVAAHIVLIVVGDREPHLSSLCQSMGIALQNTFPPFKQLDADGATLHTHNGALTRVFELTGLNTTHLSLSEKDAARIARRTWIEMAVQTQTRIRLITFNEKNSPDKRQKHYVVLTSAPGKNALQNLNLATEALLSRLKIYRPTLVSEKESATTDKSPLWLFTQLANPITQNQPTGSGCDPETLSHFFNKDNRLVDKTNHLITWTVDNKKKYAGAIGIRHLDTFWNEQILSDILNLDKDIVVSHNINPIAPVRAKMLLLQQQRVAALSGFSALTQEEYKHALEQLDQTQALSEHTVNIIVFGDTPESVKNTQEKIIRLYTTYNIVAVAETMATEATYLTLFPTYDACPRVFRFLSSVSACVFDFDQPADIGEATHA